jgi:hypothetical protein
MRYTEVELFVEMEHLSKELEGIAESQLTEVDRRALKEFYKALDRKRSGKSEPEFVWDSD